MSEKLAQQLCQLYKNCRFWQKSLILRGTQQFLPYFWLCCYLGNPTTVNNLSHPSGPSLSSYGGTSSVSSRCSPSAQRIVRWDSPNPPRQEQFIARSWLNHVSVRSWHAATVTLSIGWSGKVSRCPASLQGSLSCLRPAPPNSDGSDKGAAKNMQSQQVLGVP